MLKEIKLSKVAELIGHVPQTLRAWKNSISKQDNYKFDAVMLGATLMENGFTPDQVLFMARYGFKMKEMSDRINELEQTLLDVGSHAENALASKGDNLSKPKT